MTALKKTSGSHPDGKEEECRTVILAPNPAIFIQSMRYIGYTIKTALADIIDNSITAEAGYISVRFRWNNGNPWLAILDDGCGMSEDKLQEAMRFGGDLSPSDKRDADDLGRFGLGLKTASLSQCRRLTVVSKQGGVTSALRWDVDALVKNVSEWSAQIPNIVTLREDPEIVPLLDCLNVRVQGTLVLWQSIDGIVSDGNRVSEKHFSQTLEAAAKHVGEVFHRFIEPDRECSCPTVAIDFNGRRLETISPFGNPETLARQELATEEITVWNEKIIVSPFILPHYCKTSPAEYHQYSGNDGYLHSQGFYVYRNCRLIIKATWFGLLPKLPATQLIRVKVDIPNTLDRVWQLDVKKSQANPPEVVLDELKRFIKRIEDSGRRAFTRQPAKLQEDAVTMWRREMVDDQILYFINEEHPFARKVLEDAYGRLDQEKCECLRLLCSAFPQEAFQADIGDGKVVFGMTGGNAVVRGLVRNLMLAQKDAGIVEKNVKANLAVLELPISPEEVNALFAEVFA